MKWVYPRKYFLDTKYVDDILRKHLTATYVNVESSDETEYLSNVRQRFCFESWSLHSVGVFLDDNQMFLLGLVSSSRSTQRKVSEATENVSERLKCNFETKETWIQSIDCLFLSIERSLAALFASTKRVFNSMSGAKEININGKLNHKQNLL